MHPIGILRRIFVTALFGLMLLPGLWAQGARGRITGSVADPTGAVVPGATITATQAGTGVTYTGETQANGVYLIPNLIPGTYSVSVAAAGFKRLTIDGLKVDVATTLTQDLTLQIGQVNETVEVSGQTSLVETTSGSVGTTVNVNQVLELAMADRSVFSLLNLSPAAWYQAGDNLWGGYGATVSLGGARGQSQLATIDGVDNSRGGIGVQNVEMALPVDAVQEFRVQTNNLSAEYGRTSGGVLNAVTKSGTNAYHGSLYEFVRNDKFDAIGWGNTTKQKLRRNAYGFTVGGPIRKNRTFFFFNWDRTQQIVGNTQISDVGLPEWRSGDFSKAMRHAGGRAEFVPIYDPETGTGTFGAPRTTTPFPGNIIPTNRLDPVALKALSYYPKPNRPPDNSFNLAGNFAENGRNEIMQNYWVGRVDHDLTQKTKMYGRYIIASPRNQQGGGSPSFGPAVNGERSDDRLQNIALNFNHLFSPTFFANLTTGVERLKVSVQGGCAWCGQNFAQELGVKGVPGPVFPQFALGTGLVPIKSVGGGPDRSSNVTTSTMSLDFTKIRGNHTLKFGTTYTRFNTNTGNTAHSGSWSFDGHFTRGVSATGAAVANTGINMADFLLGRLTSASASIAPTQGRRAQHGGVYFQDDWRVTSRLTLNVGMRWDTQNPTYAVDGRMSNFNPYLPSPLAGTGDIPAGALGAMQYQGKGGVGKYLWDWDKKTFSPRFGFAWRVFGTNETVVRGGYGIFFGSPTTGGTSSAGILGYGLAWSVGDPVPFRLRDGAPDGALVAPPESALNAAFGQRGTAFAQSGVSFFDPYAAYPYTQNFNLTIQHQWRSTLIEVGYLGNLARHAASASLNLNRIPTELLARTDIAERLKRPYAVFTGNAPGVTDAEYRNGISNYHGLTLKLERRARNGLAYSLAYTFSKLIDDINYQTAFAFTWGDNVSPQNIYNRASERSLSTNCIPHRLVVAPVYELPFGKGRQFLNQGGVLDAILGGWQVSSVGTMQTGAPFGPTVLNGARDVLGDQSGTLRPNLIGDPNASNQGQPAVGVRGLQWLNPAAFAVPARNTYGNQSRTLPGVLGPGIVRFDTMIGKNFRYRERYRLQFRWEMLDVFNTPAFDNIGRWPAPGQNLGAGNFGIVTSANALSRRIMQFGLKLYW